VGDRPHGRTQLPARWIFGFRAGAFSRFFGANRGGIFRKGKKKRDGEALYFPASDIRDDFHYPGFPLCFLLRGGLPAGRVHPHRGGPSLDRRSCHHGTLRPQTMGQKIPVTSRGGKRRRHSLPLGAGWPFFSPQGNRGGGDVVGPFLGGLTDSFEPRERWKKRRRGKRWPKTRGGTANGGISRNSGTSSRLGGPEKSPIKAGIRMHPGASRQAGRAPSVSIRNQGGAFSRR